MAGKWKAAGWAAAGLLLAAYAAFGLMHLSPWAATRDEVDFVLALDRFDLLAMQPHAPGYPYFIFGGRLIRPFLEDPILALGAWNLLLTCSSVFPIYRIARRLLPPAASVLTAGIVLTVPMNWALAVRPMSEGAALALLWWYLWTLVRLSEKRTDARWLAAVTVFGLLMGTRLSYVPFGVGLAVVWLAACLDPKVPAGRKVWRAAWWAAAAAGMQLLWIVAVAAAEGGLAGTIRLLAGFGQGHFTDWGGGVSPASGMPFLRRTLTFFADNWFWSAAAVKSGWIAAVVAGLLLILLWRLWKERGFSFHLKKFLVSPWGILIVSAAAYTLWAWLGQNIAKPRHAAPLAALTMFALTVGTSTKGTLRKTAIGVAVLLAVVQTVEGARLVVLQQGQKPAVYQLADRLAAQPDASTVVYAWEEDRILRFVGVPVQTRPIFTYEYFHAQIEAERHSRVLLTESVWAEFRRQGKLTDTKVKPLAEFESDLRLDPVYGHLVLYEWIR